MNLDTKDKYRLEYAEIGHLRRHYSTVRSSLTTFSLTVSLAAFASSMSPSTTSWYPAFIGIFMLFAAAIFCLHFSWRCEIASLYAKVVWRWFGEDNSNEPGHFYDFRPRCSEVFREVRRDWMNWLMLLALFLIAGVYWMAKIESVNKSAQPTAIRSVSGGGQS